MKIVFTTSGTELNAALDGRFGRAPNFLVFDLDSETFEVVDNQQNLNAAQGSGIRSAETVARRENWSNSGPLTLKGIANERG